LGAGIVGFALISIGIYYTVNGRTNATPVAILSGLSGIVTEFISAVFFYLYSQTVRQMKAYHDSLLAVQNVLLSFKLVGDTKDPKDKADMVRAMLDFLVGSPTNVAGGFRPRQKATGSSENALPSSDENKG
jgi:hypothetical protein